MPDINRFKAWRLKVYSNTNAASGRPDHKAVAWLKKVENPECLITDFGNSTPEFVTLDMKLSSALQSISTGDLGRTMSRFNEQVMKTQDRPANGRELLFLIFKYYDPGRSPFLMYDSNDIQNVRLNNDN
jgi:hypothetical protein